MSDFNEVFQVIGMMFSIIFAAIILLVVCWYIFSAICTIIFIRRIAAYSDFKNKHGKPISLSSYMREFIYWQHHDHFTYHVTMSKTGEYVFMPWPYATKLYRQNVKKQREAEWRALG